MKWYKHLSGSLKDSVIFEAIEIFGSDAYLVFFGTLELMADEFDIYNPGTVRISMKKMTRFFQLSRQKTVRILQHFHQKAESKPQEKVSFLVQFEKEHVVITCKRLAELCDNHTQSLLRDASKSLQSENEATSSVEAEVEEERDKDRKAVLGEHNTGRHAKPQKDKSPRQPSSTPQDFKKLEPIAERLRPHFPGVNEFISQFHVNGHVDALEKTLSHLEEFIKKNGVVPRSCWAYCASIMLRENGNFHEQDHTRKAQEQKGTREDGKRTMKRFGEIMKNITQEDKP